MNNLTIKNLIEASQGKLIIGNEKDKCVNFSKDTREIEEGDTYIGIKGENFDGNLLWEKALENGARTIVVQGINFENINLEKWKKENKNIILVEDSRKALQDIARFKRCLYGDNFPLVAVTGSVGKTSTKDMIANVLGQKFKTLKTEGNHNNDIGLPFTILKLKDEEVAVIEMGMNHFGEIRLLTNIAKPTISVITNIGTSHIGNLGSRENILKAKLEILEGMKKPRIIINEDNDLLRNWHKENVSNINTYGTKNVSNVDIHTCGIENVSNLDIHTCGIENVSNVDIHTYGIENASEVMAENIELKEDCSIFDCVIGNEKIKIRVPVNGIHFVYNAICAATVGKLLGLSCEEIKNGIETFSLTKRRMDITDLKNGVKIINDAYNASFESMKASLKSLSEYKNKRKIAVLGDMFELGDYAEELHKKVGQEVVKNNIDILICCGENAKYIVDEAKNLGFNNNNVRYFNNKDEVLECLLSNTKENDVILFKASNGMKFFDIANKYMTEKNI